MRKILLFICCSFLCCIVSAQVKNNQSAKISPYVRTLLKQCKDTRAGDDLKVTTFVKTYSGKEDVLIDAGARVLALMGKVYVIEIPMSRIDTLSKMEDVMRIETGRSCTVHLDTAKYCVDYDDVNAGVNLPRAFTGRGVVMGIMDVGFDLTSPNFYSRDMSDYRIRSFWDMLSQDKDSSFVVGREYVGRDEITALKHSADNLIISHGTHTLGIAAGSGYNSDYIGVAPEADICLVNNAVSDDYPLIPEEDKNLYTLATDALGFKYIFDYASSQGKPCVISFSEGAEQGFGEDDQLYFEALESLVGPGRILVASAGNNGGFERYMFKPADQMKCGSFVYSPYEYAYLALKSKGPFDMVIKSYGSEIPDIIAISSKNVKISEEGMYKIKKEACGIVYDITVAAWPSAFDPEETVYELLIESDQTIGAAIPLSIELFGLGNDVQMFAYQCVFMDNLLDESLSDQRTDYCVSTPAAAPAVIAVGATTYREGFVNYKGEYLSWSNGSNGFIAPYSSVGPTFDGRIKPDVAAPGTNVISSYSSYYIEAKPDAFDTQSDVVRYDYDGRTYSWNANTGTSMASPMVGGIIALWLEADPNLSPDDIREIMASTCSHNDDTMEYPNNKYGHGEINAYRGLLRILNIDGIEGITDEAYSYSLIPSDNGFDIRFNKPLENNADVDVYTTGGVKVRTLTLPAGVTSYHVNVAPGVYAVRVYTDNVYQSSLVRTR